MIPPLAPSTRIAEQRLRGIALRIAAGACFAALGAAVKFASEAGVNTLELVFYRSLFAAPMILAWACAGPGLAAIRTRRPWAHVTRTVIGMTNMLFFIEAIVLLPLADATAIGFSAPLFATALSALVLGEKVGRHRWMAVAIGFAGVLILLRPGGSPLPPAGLAVALIAAFGTSVVTITIRQISTTENVAAIVLWLSVGGTLLTGLAMPFYAQAHDAATWGWLVLMALFGGAAQIFQTGSLRHAPVASLVPFDYVQLLWAIAIGWLVWDHAPALATLAGGALIAATGIYTVWRERRLGQAERAAATPPGL